MDCCLFEKDHDGNDLKVFVELKAYEENKSANGKKKDVDDLKEYLRDGKVRYGVLTDGINWEFYINLRVLVPSLSSDPIIKIDCSSEKDDIDNNNKFEEFLCIENANYMLNRLDGIWKESFWEPIKSHDTESSIDLLAHRRKHEMVSK